VYKNYLKKNNEEMIDNWEKVHREALSSVNRDMGIKYYRHCCIPGSNKILTTKENKLKEEEEAINICAMIMMIEEDKL